MVTKADKGQTRVLEQSMQLNGTGAGTRQTHTTVTGTKGNTQLLFQSKGKLTRARWDSWGRGRQSVWREQRNDKMDTSKGKISHPAASLTSHLLPCVQQHHVLLVQITLGEVTHLGHPELPNLIGAFEQAGTVTRLLPLQSETTQSSLLI